MTKPEPTRTTPAQRRTQQARQAIVRIAGVVPSPSRLLVESVADALLAAEQAAREEALGGKDVADAIRKAARRAALEEAAEKLPRRRSGGPCPKPPLDRAFFVDWLRARADENEAKGEQDG